LRCCGGRRPATIADCILDDEATSDRLGNYLCRSLTHRFAGLGVRQKLLPYRAAAKRRGRCVPPQLAEFVLEMQFGLGRDIPTSPFPLEFGAESVGCWHSSSIGKLPAVGREAQRAVMLGRRQVVGMFATTPNARADNLFIWRVYRRRHSPASSPPRLDLRSSGRSSWRLCTHHPQLWPKTLPSCSHCPAYQQRLCYRNRRNNTTHRQVYPRRTRTPDDQRSQLDSPGS
jgi:hypothetical protein